MLRTPWFSYNAKNRQWQKNNVAKYGKVSSRFHHDRSWVRNGTRCQHLTTRALLQPVSTNPQIKVTEMTFYSSSHVKFLCVQYIIGRDSLGIFTVQSANLMPWALILMSHRSQFVENIYVSRRCICRPQCFLYLGLNNLYAWLAFHSKWITRECIWGFLKFLELTYF